MQLSLDLSRLRREAKELKSSTSAIKAAERLSSRRDLAGIETRIESIRASAISLVPKKVDALWAAWAELSTALAYDAMNRVQEPADDFAGQAPAPAERFAANAEFDAQDAINFATYAVEQAEYHVLLAVVAWKQAGDGTRP